MSSCLLSVPAAHRDFLSHVDSHPDTPVAELIEPYQKFDAKIREVFAQEPQHPALADPYLNVTPVFTGHEKSVKVRARNLAAESQEEKEKYLMPLPAEKRRANGSPAIVQSFKEFQTNFNLFSESSLVDMDWSNVVAAGSSVVTPLLPVPPEHAGSKRALRRYYHEILAPASDVDLFIYGLTEDEALEKIKQVEKKIKDAILEETTTVRTKNAITIASKFPTRHVQIVLRIYKSVAEILTGFDVDCSCVAYDGKQVYAAPRALASYITQVNTIDLTRRSPSYENRLSKYSKRGFEIHWSQLDRSRIDPTIFERNFARTQGLARLLVLEKLPTSTERDAYMDQRRYERGRPAINRFFSRKLGGNIKDDHEDEVAEWVESDEVSDYHTFTIPYGERFHAKKISQLLYAKDLLLNAEWNKPEDREVNLHRHPAFFGNAEDVFYDCCGYCPKPSTLEEEKVAEEESKIYISGNISFVKDDPGRQAIGSFHPLTDDDWTEMAYVGNTARLCQAIVDGDLTQVKEWLSQEGSDPNQRDYTGRTPLHLAAACSTSDIVQALVDAGARLVARLADGRTALHIAAARGDLETVKILMRKSQANEEEEANKEDLRKQAWVPAKDDENECLEDDEAEIINRDEESSETEGESTTTGSYVKVRKEENEKETENLPEDENDEPDIYDINVLGWDVKCSPLHLAIVNGHCEVVEELCQSFGADVLLPIKLMNTYSYNKRPRAAILTLVLATRLPLGQAHKMTDLLLKLGASSAQADMDQITALHRFTTQDSSLLQRLIDHDRPAAQRAINHLKTGGYLSSVTALDPLMSAIEGLKPKMALQLLGAGAKPEIEFSRFMDSYLLLAENERHVDRDAKENLKNFRQAIQQPVLRAVEVEMPDIVLALLEHGADPNTLTVRGWECVEDEYRRRYSNDPGQSLLDAVRSKLTVLRSYDGDRLNLTPPQPDFEGDGSAFVEAFEDDSYKQWTAVRAVQVSLASYESSLESYQKQVKEDSQRPGRLEKQAAIQELIKRFENVEKELLSRGAKPFYELYPNIGRPQESRSPPNNEEDKTSWKVDFNFRVPDLTDESEQAYLNIFEAAWTGDIQTIKTYTIGMWGPEQKKFPLKIAVKDGNGLSAFHIAVLRGHVEAAKAILAIAQAQYLPKENKQKARYTLKPANPDDEGPENEDSIQVFKEIVDDQYTIDDLGDLSRKVKNSTTDALAFLQWEINVPKLKGDESHPRYDPSLSGVLGLFSHPRAGTWEYSDADNLVQFAIQNDDITLLQTLMSWGNEYTVATAAGKEDDSVPGFYMLKDGDFQYALTKGRTRCLEQIIKKAGTGIPLDHLAKKSGVEIVEKPKYYQGLSIHGEKRADWAAAGREMQPTQSENTHPPLLEAARTGNLFSLEFFLSDTPARCYQEFAEANKEDKRLKNMEKIDGGFERAINGWLHTRYDLLIHCVVLSDTRSMRLLDYAIKAAPASLEKKSSSGQTPLHLAFMLGRYTISKRLIAAGANQTVRDSLGSNLLHAVLSSRPNKEPSKLYKMLALIDTRLLASLFTERSSAGIGAVTPLSRWLYEDAEDKDCDAEVLRHLLSLSPTDEHLEMVNGAGDTPLHVLVRKGYTCLIEVLLDRNPRLLYRENATGRTPAEMAYDIYMGECFEDPPALPNFRWGFYYSSGSKILDNPPESFLSDDAGDHKSTATIVWDLCRERMERDASSGSAKRKLVSLGEANEVARRLAKKQKKVSDNKDVEEEEDRTGDEVAAWSYDAYAWTEE